MAWPKGFAGAVNTDIDAAGIGASKITGASGAFRLTGHGRAYRAVASQTTFYHFSDSFTDTDYRVKFRFKVDSTTLTERIGITMRDTSTNATTGRNFVHLRLRTAGSVNAFIEVTKAVGGTFPGSALGTYNLTIAADTEYEFVGEMIDDQFRLYASDGVTLLLGPITIADAVLQNAGKVGLYSSGDSTAATPGATDGTGTGSHLVNVDFVSLNADVEATGSPATITVTAPTGSIVVEGADVEATGAPPAVTVTAPTGLASSGLSLQLLTDFDGSNADGAGSVITNGDTSTPTLDLAIRNPEGGTPLWQHFLYALHNPDAASKTVTVNTDLTNQEGGNTIRSTWSGPYRCNVMTDHNGWAAMSRSATGGVLTYTVVVGAGETVYIASMPPNTRSQVLDWLADLVAAHPTWIHDDTEARLAHDGDPYVADIAPTVLDDLGRTHSNEPMLSFRVGNDSVGTPKQKKRVVLFASLHPGEHHGFIQLRGCINQWLTDVGLTSARNDIELWVYPLGAPNGVKAGYRRYEPRVGWAEGDNLNREWRAGTPSGVANKWKAILDLDHGTGFDRVEGLIDFHDLSHSTQIVTVYHRAETPNLASYLAIISAEFTGEQIIESGNSDTTTDYFVNTKGVGPAFTAEVSDQAASLAGFEAVGASWANILGDFYAAGLLGAPDVFAGGAPASVTVTAPTGQIEVPADAGGTPAVISVSAPTGTITAGVVATGEPATITVTAPTGQIEVPANASGTPAVISVTAPTGVASVPDAANASGAPAIITVTAPTGVATNGLVQLLPNTERTFAPFPDYSTMVA